MINPPLQKHRTCAAMLVQQVLVTQLRSSIDQPQAVISECSKVKDVNVNITTIFADYKSRLFSNVTKWLSFLNVY